MQVVKAVWRLGKSGIKVVQKWSIVDVMAV